ncbi:MAG: hypothetical protein SCALA702_10040 [Melioribacteraceae bacterium]|nr:MAG: hypothetical protein SCALA702_10040 [Melioribacteraceae bacterium]
MGHYGRRERVDALISQFWKSGYLTISRKYGKYLPEPNPIGDYEVDVVAKFKKKMAIGVTLTKEELLDDNIITRLRYLSSRHTRYTNNTVKLFVGVPRELMTKARFIVSELGSTYSKNIKLVPLNENTGR